jgi:hypothetical protein
MRAVLLVPVFVHLDAFVGQLDHAEIAVAYVDGEDALTGDRPVAKVEAAISGGPCDSVRLVRRHERQYELAANRCQTFFDT